MNSNAFTGNGFGMDPTLLSANEELDSMFSRSRNTPSGMDFDWGTYGLTPTGNDFGAAVEYPFPGQEPDTLAASYIYPTNGTNELAQMPCLEAGTLDQRIAFQQYSTKGTLPYSNAQQTYSMDEAIPRSNAQQLSFDVEPPAPAEPTMAESKPVGAKRSTRSRATQPAVETSPVTASPEVAPKPVRRRGARKKIRSPEELKEKRDNHLKRNRDAAQKCRQRKKDAEDRQREHSLTLSRTNAELWGLFEQQQQELHWLADNVFPTVQAWETDKLAACERAMAMERELSAKMQAIRKVHDQNHLVRHHHGESPELERSFSQLSHRSNDYQSPLPVPPLSRSSSQQSAGHMGYSQQRVFPAMSNGEQPGYAKLRPPIASTIESATQSLRVNTAMSRQNSASSGIGSGNDSFNPAVHRRSHDSGIANVNTPGSKVLGSPYVNSPENDEAFESASGSPVQREHGSAHPHPNQRIPFFVPVSMTSSGPDVGVDPAEFMSRNSFLFGRE